jgi:hypothetical protein
VFTFRFKFDTVLIRCCRSRLVNHAWMDFALVGDLTTSRQNDGYEASLERNKIYVRGLFIRLPS